MSLQLPPGSWLTSSNGAISHCRLPPCLIVPGVYDLTFRPWYEGHIQVRSALDLTVETSPDLSDVKLAELRGTLTINGSQMAQGHALWLKGEAGDIPLGAAGTDYTVMLLPGGYEIRSVLYPGDGSGMDDYYDPGPLTDYPVNVNGRLGCVDLRLE